MKENICLILQYYYFLGKKWTYPILFHMKNNKEYNFEDFIFVSRRKLSRSVLLNFLHEALKLSIIEKNGRKYRLTPVGVSLKEEFLKVKDILLQMDKDACGECRSKALIDQEREFRVGLDD